MNLATASRESRLILFLEADYLGRMCAKTNKDWSANKFPVGSDAWQWWCEAYERERDRELLRHELEKVHVSAGLERGELSQVQDSLDAAEPQPPSLWEMSGALAFFRWFFGTSEEK